MERRQTDIAKIAFGFPCVHLWLDRLGSAMRYLCLPILLGLAAAPLFAQKHVPPKRSSQIQDGFGINADLPRDPYLPCDRH